MKDNLLLRIRKTESLIEEELGNLSEVASDVNELNEIECNLNKYYEELKGLIDELIKMVE